jgi:hypothetical protein
VRRDARVRRRDQRARQQRLGQRWRSSDDDQQLVDVGSERLAAPAVLAPQQAAPWQHVLDHATVARALPLHAVAHDAVDLLAAPVAQHALTIGRFDDEVPAVGAHHEAGVQRHIRASVAIGAVAHRRGVRVMSRAPRLTDRSPERAHAGFGDSAASRSPAGGCE